VNSIKLQVFTHSKSLYKVIRKQLGWSKIIANVALKAYTEFIEMKIITKDFDSGNIVPSWCVREVWKTHALCDAKQYETDCKGLCGNVIKYQIWVKPDPEGGISMNEEFTENVYKIRFNRSPPKPIWSFNFNPQWKNEYQSEKDLKYSKRVKDNKEESASQNKNENTGEKKTQTPASLTVASFYGLTKTTGAAESDQGQSSSPSLLQSSASAEPSRIPTTQYVSSSSSDIAGPSTSSSNGTIENSSPSSPASTTKNNISVKTTRSCTRRLRSSNAVEAIIASGSESHGTAVSGGERSSGQLGTSSSSSSPPQPPTGNLRRHRCDKRRSTVTRNSVMTRARTKMLRIDL